MEYSGSGLAEFDILSILITEQKRRVAAFLSVREKRCLLPIGTAFFVDFPIVETSRYAVTARHVIEGRRGDLFLEMTDAAGDYLCIPTKSTDWYASDDTDLACCL